MDQVEEVKNKTDIVELVSGYTQLKPAGRNWKGLCPFHQEKTPSFMVNPELQIYKCFGCFPAGQLMRIPGGLRPIEDIKEGEVVVSGKARIRKVLKTFKRPYEGSLITVTPWKFADEITMTVDHKVKAVVGSPYTMDYKNLSKRVKAYEKKDRDDYLRLMEKYFPIQDVPAGQLKKGQCLLFPIDGMTEDIEAVDLKQFITKVLPPHGTKPAKINYTVPIDQDFLKLAGFYIAEGSNNRAYIRFSIGDHEWEWVDEIRQIVRRLFNLKVQIHTRTTSRTGIEITVCHSMLANIFENLFGKGADKKRIPEMFMRLPAAKQRVLVEAIKKGDGTIFAGNKSERIHHSITTISSVLAIQLREILLRLDYFPTFFRADAKVDKKGVNHREAYAVIWSDEAMSRYNIVYETRDGIRYWLLPIRKLSRKEFAGDVYNLMVEEDHSYIPRAFVVGNCGKGGDVISFVEGVEGVEFKEALQILADKAGVKLVFKSGEKSSLKDETLLAHETAVKYYQYLLVEHKVGEEARKYLKERGMSGKIIQSFRVGFALPAWDGLARYLIEKKKFKPEVLERGGLIIKGNKGGYYDRFRNRIIFPLIDNTGRVVGLAGRVMPGADEKDGAKYINSPETEIYHKSRMLYGLYQAKKMIREKDRVVLVEGEMDMISSFAAGVGETVAVKGTALTEEQVKLLSRLTKNLILALDADGAGQLATRRSIELAEKEGMYVKVVQIKGGKDPDDIARESASKWKKEIEGAIDVYDFYLESAVKRYGTQTPEGKRRVSEEVVRVLSRIENEIIRAHFVKKLANLLETEVENVMAMMKRVGVERFVKVEDEKRRPEQRGIQVEMLALIFRSEKKEAGKMIERILAMESDGGMRRILERWQSTETDLVSFIKGLPAEIRGLAEEAYLIEVDEDRLERDLEEVVAEFEKRRRRGRIGELQKEIEEAEGEGDDERLKELQEKVVRLSKKLV